MKTEEPGDRVPVVKYGMGASEQHKIVERHFAVMEERQAIDAAQLAHALHVGPSLRAAMENIGKRPKPTLPPPAPTHKMRDGALVGLRERLGLG